MKKISLLLTITAPFVCTIIGISPNTWRFAENQWDYVGSTLLVSSGRATSAPGGTRSGKMSLGII